MTQLPVVCYRFSRYSTLFRSQTDVTDPVYFSGFWDIYSVVVGGIRASATFDSSNDHSVLVTVESDRKTELADTHLTAWAVLERFAIVWWVAPRRIDDFVEFVDNALLLVRIECIEVVLCVRCEFPIHPSSLIRIASTESFARFFGTHRLFFTNVLFSLEECNEFIAVERGVFDGIA